MARAMGIDYGTKRTGVSVTDPLRLIVNSLITIPTDELDHFVEQYLKKEKVDLIVFGDPFHTDGTPTEINKIIHKIGDHFQKKYSGTQIDYFDETLTSKQAVHQLLTKGTPKKKRTKEAIDMMSAVIILQKYLNHI